MVTKRTKNLKKQEIPSLDDPISKLNHIGKETVKKLNELAAAAAESEIDLRLPPDLHQCVPWRSPFAASHSTACRPLWQALLSSSKLCSCGNVCMHGTYRPRLIRSALAGHLPSLAPARLPAWHM